MRVDVDNHFYPGSYLQRLEEHGEGVRIGTDRAGRRYLEEGGTRLVTLTKPMLDLEARFAMPGGRPRHLARSKTRQRQGIR